MGGGVRGSSASSNGTQFREWDPIWQTGPYVGKGTRILQMGPVAGVLELGLPTHVLGMADGTSA
jgi:hypothetical protein